MTVLTRRQFAAGLGGIVVAFSMHGVARARQRVRLPGSLAHHRRLDAWLRINADGTATIFTGKVELGQGILTALAQIAAEELSMRVERIDIISGDTARTPDEGITSGSRSLETSGAAIRAVCAEARDILIRMASEQLRWSFDELSVQDGVIYAPGLRTVSYAELAGSVDLHRVATGKIAPAPAGAHRIVGKPVKRLDIPGKVTGAPMFVQDVRLPNMLHGRVVRPPRYHAILDKFDEGGAKALPGVVTVVRDGSFLGVVAQREEQAVRAREHLVRTSKWIGDDALPDPRTLHDKLIAAKTEDRVMSETEAPPPAGIARVFEATFTRPYIAHASIGPSCALAQYESGKLTVWSHTQGVFPLRRSLASALGLDERAIRCIHAQGSGCYGHNGADDVALDAALLARAVQGRPVRVQWMRDDEFAWEPYGPAMVMKVKAALAGGKVADWSYDVWSPTHSTRPDGDGGNLLATWHLARPMQPDRGWNGGGGRNAEPLYAFPGHRVTNHFVPESPLRASALRSLGAHGNVCAIESFMDELAAAAGADPIAFRLAHLKDERARAVIEAAAKAAGWKEGGPGDGKRGRGIGFAQYKNAACYVAVIADVVVDRASGRLRVRRAYAAADAGQIVNPDGLTNQIEGGITQGASWTLQEEVKFAADGIISRDWLSYPILTIPDAPNIETVLIDRPDQPSLGAGEAALGPAAAAIANGFAHATGKRLRDLPFCPARVKAVLA
jgi:CO/xanthine dehydrogenase Mo-binding subunit